MRPRVCAKPRSLRGVRLRVRGTGGGDGGAWRRRTCPSSAGAPWGAPWSTTWFRISGKVPSDWAGLRVEAVFDLGFNDRSPGFQAEGLAFGPDGPRSKRCRPATTGSRSTCRWPSRASWTCFVEAVAMPGIMGRGRDDRFAAHHAGRPGHGGAGPPVRAGGADLVVVDEDALALVLDVEVLLGVMGQLPVADPRRHEILRALERAWTPTTWTATPWLARRALSGVMSAPAARTAHRISAVGHAHIDSAWLWPVRETVRKCARTFCQCRRLGAGSTPSSSSPVPRPSSGGG